jgi:hypothetical protein
VVDQPGIEQHKRVFYQDFWPLFMFMRIAVPSFFTMSQSENVPQGVFSVGFSPRRFT